MPGLKLKHVPPHDRLPPALADMTEEGRRFLSEHRQRPLCSLCPALGRKILIPLLISSVTWYIIILQFDCLTGEVSC